MLVAETVDRVREERIRERGRALTCWGGRSGDRPALLGCPGEGVSALVADTGVMEVARGRAPRAARTRTLVTAVGAEACCRREDGF